MNGTTAAVTLLFACSQAGAEEVQSPKVEQPAQPDAAAPGVFEGAIDGKSFVVRSAISGRVELTGTMLGQLTKEGQNGFAVVLLSETPDECALREKNTARKGARYVVMRLADRSGRYNKLTTPPRSGGERGVGVPSDMQRADVQYVIRGVGCEERVVKEAEHGSIRLLGLVKSKTPPLYRGQFELTFGRNAGAKVKGEFRAPICEAFSQQLKLGAKAPAPTCVGPGEEAPAKAENK